MGKLAQKLHIGVHGELRVLLDNDELHAGDAVTGSVQLRVTKAITRAKLTLRLWGCERMDWDSVESGRAAFAKVAHRRSWQFLGHDIILNEPDAEWAVGDYVYPFAFEIPFDCPHTFEYKCSRIAEMEDIRVEMMYRATAKLEAEGVLTANMETEVPFTIVPEALARPVGQPISITRTHAVKAVGFIKSGTCTVTLETPTDVISPADAALEAVVKLDLDTKKRLKHVEVTLFEDVVVDRNRKYLPGIHRLSRAVSISREDIALDHASPLTLQFPISLGSALNKADAEVFPTMMTQFLWIGYRIEVDCHFSSLSSTIKVHVPITMVRAPPSPPSPPFAQPA